MSLEDSLDLLDPPSAAASGYLTCDSHANSDYDDTDGEAGAYTDGEAEDAYDQPGLARSSEPAQTSPSQGLSEQVGPRILGRGAGGAEGGGMGANSCPLWHRQGVISSCCRVRLRIHAQLWFSTGKAAQPQAGAQILPLPLPLPPPSPVSRRHPSSSGKASGASATTASGTPRRRASSGLGKGPRGRRCRLCLAGPCRAGGWLCHPSPPRLLVPQGLRARRGEEEVHTSQG